MVTVAGAQMADRRFGCLRVNANVESNQRLEKAADHWLRPPERWRLIRCAQECVACQIQQPRRKRRIRKVVLRCLSKPGEGVSRRRPRGQRIEQPTAVSRHRGTRSLWSSLVCRSRPESRRPRSSCMTQLCQLRPHRREATQAARLVGEQDAPDRGSHALRRG